MDITLDGLRAEVAATLGVPPDELAPDGNLMDAGLDSIRVMMLIERWREEGARVGFAELAEIPTLEGWHAVLTAD
ncbi:phosphopantetheine-binding protein [Actinomadura atramentaria]|uniref:phosphopantetheine-binding protein n=1 Tax=Actinomadura atramentaria TaxID=1990 RepID=UPI00036651C8|nr:phosphopantetheine-binding protein [Actinomadura atramentaria]